MNVTTRLAVAALLTSGAATARADVINQYDVSAVFSDGGIQGVTTFNGSFDWDATTQTVSNFTGFLSESMWSWNSTKGTFTTGANGTGTKATGYTGEVYSQTYSNGDAPLLNLTHQLASSTSGSMVSVSTFLQNSTDVVAGGGYDVVSADNALAYGDPTNANRNYNAFFTLTFDSSNITSTTATVNDLVYGDETSLGMMGPMLTGWVGMTGYYGVTNGGGNGGSMGGLPESLTITEVSAGAPAAVPVPGAVWLFGSAVLGLLGSKRRSAALPG